MKRPQERAYALQRWQEDGGIMIIGYEMYRNLTQGRNIKSKKLKETFQKTLVNPGEVRPIVYFSSRHRFSTEKLPWMDSTRRRPARGGSIWIADPFLWLCALLPCMIYLFFINVWVRRL